MKILVTGGAGYIGSHITKKLIEENFQVVVLDNLSAGFIEPIEILKKELNLSEGMLEFVKADLADKEELINIFSKRSIDAVMHLAAKVDVAESVLKPDLYYQENYLNGISLLEAMVSANVNKIIFSSTCAVYGNPQYLPIDEKHQANPMSPYGETKLDFEKYLQKITNLQLIILRYFNVGGSSVDGLIGKSHLDRQDLMEGIMKVALGQEKYFTLFGEDFHTPDKTAVRDYLHVEDICQAHILALRKINSFSGNIFNLGSEKGYSVKEVVEEARRIIDKEIPVKIAPRREGDVEKAVASSAKAKEILGWQRKYSDLETIIKTDWLWRKNHPFGYKN